MHHNHCRGWLTQARCLPRLQMCLALQHLHSHGVAHLDVKPDNIYGTELDDDNRPRVYKLGDFGQATRFDSQGKVAVPEQAVNEGDCRWAHAQLCSVGLSTCSAA